MSLTAMRPTFEVRLPHPPNEVSKRIGSELQKPVGRCKSLFFENYLELHLPDAEIRYWSPHLSLSFDGDGTHTRVSGRFAPRQDVWTFVWTIYMTLAFAAFFSSIFTCAFWMMGQSTWLGAATFSALAGIGLLYIASQIGQRLSADQMVVLNSDWNKLIEQANLKEPASVQDELPRPPQN